MVVVCAVAFAVSLCMMSAVAQQPLPAPSGSPSYGTIDTNHFMDDSMRIREDQKRQKALILLRHQEMTADTVRLLALVVELKAKSEKPNRSFGDEDVIKAVLIEKLARSVRTKMAETN
jgi:hypothetical protein